ncbi:aminomethyl-transferring glycine dehydrogenase subunit GcvPB [Staphylothermus hellenicus]|uniref:Probable glycine dehydrogenase (decarboxylating) subunit 2 n=1 Tax=Staphylothermus hellenicus (strain DSM 12710 / JCM 10830 / BK20S6-10-b1 / P8) TaxID=591019 RepID=D7D9J7_STAHD|nr:aminomethyl-transferring glycine dehydrogenase subunit GcvPB [Staphylothermus hellenicus]ADI32443.1 Glycine dehydrogenase (decarboxylating) [Staphylothermus hellenicus DSM 12710]
MFRQARWDEPLIFELGNKGRKGFIIPEPEEDVKRKVGKIKISEKILREKPPNLPEVSEVEVIRHYTRLTEMSYGVDNGPVPLGSCTMKYNPRIAWEISNDYRINMLHPLQDERTVQGLLEILYELQKWLANITGMDYCSLHPAAGAHGEFAGILIIRKYHELKNQLDRKSEIIIPDSAHGTNPASASMGGFKVVEVPSGEDGNIDMDALRSVVGESTAGLMITNPSTLGLFEENIVEISKIIHGVDGLLYYDGANLNGIMGYTRPGDMGFDIAHINIHKTFGSPHGGGGPGAGPVCIKDRLIDKERNIWLRDLLPGYRVVYDENTGLYKLVNNEKYSIGLLKAFFGNIIPLIWGYIYILMLGSKGLRTVTEHAVLNTNYFISLVKDIKGYDIPYGKNRYRKHEVVLSAKPLYDDTGVSAEDIAKGLLDAGFYAPTIYFPLIVHEALMTEFTESETIENIEKYAERLREISNVSYSDPDKAKKWPLNTSVRRVDNVRANHPKTLAPTWRIYVEKVCRKHDNC